MRRWAVVSLGSSTWLRDRHYRPYCYYPPTLTFRAFSALEIESGPLEAREQVSFLLVELLVCQDTRVAEFRELS